MPLGPEQLGLRVEVGQPQVRPARLPRDAVRAGADIGSNSWGEDSQGRYDTALEMCRLSLEITREIGNPRSESIHSAITRYVQEVKRGQFPDKTHSFS